MIFTTLELENFRVFNGTHSIDLAPKKDGLNSKPIILFGGLNGAGKTSILTAIRLALLGRRAVGNAISNKDFQSYLLEQINNKAAKDDSTPFARVSLAFTHTHQGEHSKYKVERSWSATNDESVQLFKNNDLESSLTNDQVQSFLYELVPPRIGDLFFFDGEKIAELAEDDTGEYLKEAVQKLLGLDVIHRLSDDLDIYIKQVSQKSSDSKTGKLIEQLESEKHTLLCSANKEREKEDDVKRQLTGLEFKIREAEQKIQDRGGAWAKTKDAEMLQADALIKQSTVLETKLLNELDGVFPLSLAPKAMASLISELENEQALKDSLAFSKKLSENLSGLEEAIASQFKGSSNDVMQTIKSYFESASQPNTDEVKLDISLTDFSTIKTNMLDAERAKLRCKTLTEEFVENEQALESVSINIRRAPDEDELAGLYSDLRALDEQKYKLKVAYGDSLKNAKSYISKALEIAKKLEKLYTNQKNDSSISKAVERVDATTEVLSEFSAQLTEMRVKQLEELFERSYRKLARKEELKLSARINSTSFDVTLVDSDGLTINRKSMSAGEKQIFAFAILEALGKLSGKVLPVVVDTPLGRLDSKHRDKLIQHYFPEAGEQVILLSTDTEVDEDFFSSIAHVVSHAFEIKFDESNKCSSLKEGYFWNDRSKVEYKEVV